MENAEQKKGFRLQMGAEYNHVMLTYKTHVDRDKYTRWVRGLGKTGAKCEVFISHESGDATCEYLHSHVLLRYNCKINFVGERRFDYEGIHPHIEKVLLGKHLENMLAYMIKEDKTEEYRLSQIGPSGWYDRVSQCKTITEVMQMARSPADAMGLKTMYELKEQVVEELELELRPWQAELEREMDTFPSDRRVIWYYDKKGGEGKTLMSKWLRANKGGMLLKSATGDRDMANLIKNEMDKGWRGRVIVLDLTRSYESHKSIYSVIEAIKDGEMTSTKYNGGLVTIPRCHLVVFANFMPMVGKMSLDRWDIRGIEGGVAMPVTLKDVKSIEREDEIVLRMEELVAERRREEVTMAAEKRLQRRR